MKTITMVSYFKIIVVCKYLTSCFCFAVRVQNRCSTRILLEAVTLSFDFANAKIITSVLINWTLISCTRRIIWSWRYWFFGFSSCKYKNVVYLELWVSIRFSHSLFAIRIVYYLFLTFSISKLNIIWSNFLRYSTFAFDTILISISVSWV